ncbi:MAG: 3-deoxy-manno-octulosonate cytidylyltransferase, partial [Hyphomicrobium sp.]
LPDKPLADIHGEPMIVHVWRKAMAAECGRVVVATDSARIRDVIRAVGGEALMTRPEHTSGSDRIYEALNRVDPEADADIIVNLQGDLPSLEPSLIKSCIQPLNETGPDIATLCAEIRDPEEKHNPNVVKVVGHALSTPGRLRALYFTRACAPYGEGPLYHHIGIYAFRRVCLERFVALKPSELEIRERLEQLRAIEDGMRVDVSIVDTVPLGVDTPEDLEKARNLIPPSSAQSVIGAL